MHTEAPQAPNSTRPVHLVVVPHTHWDREWYQLFQEFHARLVRLIERLLDILGYNAGSPRPAPGNPWSLRQYGDHVDCWVQYYNTSRLS